MPESHRLDLIRPGGAIYGLESYRFDPDGQEVMDIRPVFRLCARVVRVERLEPGDGVSFGHRYVAEEPTWVATLPSLNSRPSADVIRSVSLREPMRAA